MTTILSEEEFDKRVAEITGAVDDWCEENLCDKYKEEHKKEEEPLQWQGKWQGRTRREEAV